MPTAVGWFESEFWPLWPVKENKEAARKAAEKVSRSDQSAAIDGVRAQSERISAMERPIHAATWLNNRRWEDQEHHAPRNSSGSLFNEGPTERSIRVAKERLLATGRL